MVAECLRPGKKSLPVSFSGRFMEHLIFQLYWEYETAILAILEARPYRPLLLEYAESARVLSGVVCIHPMSCLRPTRRDTPRMLTNSSWVHYAGACTKDCSNPQQTVVWYTQAGRYLSPRV